MQNSSKHYVRYKATARLSISICMRIPYLNGSFSARRRERNSIFCADVSPFQSLTDDGASPLPSHFTHLSLNRDSC